MPVEVVEQLPDPRDYFELFRTTGWNDLYGASQAELADGLRRNWCAVCALDAGRLVGFGRLLSDGVLYAVVFDMIVAPERRPQGVGARILRHLLDRCAGAGLRDVLLFSARGAAGFYEKLGFVRRPGEAPGMILRRRAG